MNGIRNTTQLLAALLLTLLMTAILPPTAVADDDDDEFVAVRAGRIITVSGEDIDGGVIVIRNGKIEAVGKKVEVPRGAAIIDATDMTVMPGLVNIRSRVGLDSFRRTGSRANLVAADEIYPDDDTWEPHLDNGFTTVALYPIGSGLPGLASIIRPIPGDRDAIVLERESYLRVPFTRPSTDKASLRKNLQQAKAEIDKIEKARKAWEEKQKKAAEDAKKAAEQKKDSPAPEKPEDKKPQNPAPGNTPQPEPKKDDKAPAEAQQPEAFKPPAIRPNLKPLVDLLRKEEGKTMLVEIAKAEGFVHLEDLAEKYEIAHQYQITNARQATSSAFSSRNDTDTHLVVDRMGKSKAAVALMPAINTIPYTRTQINLPLALHKAGCAIAFMPVNDSPDGFRHYRENVAELIKFGFPRDEALKSMTLNAARMLGLDSRLGTIEPERDANLIFLDGDPFAAFTEVKKVMIEGNVVAEPETKL